MRVDTGSGDGSLGLKLVDDDSITDLAGNPLGGAGAGNGDAASDAYEIDKTAPAVTVDSLRTSDTTPALSGTVDDAAASIEVTVAQQTHAATNNGDGTWLLADGLLPVLLSGIYDVAVAATDAAGNTGVDGSAGELRVRAVDGGESGGEDAGFFCPDSAVLDGGLESGAQGAAWAGESTVFGTPLTSLLEIGAQSGAGPHSGDGWAWFGGLATERDAASIRQTITFPRAKSATLQFYLRIPAAFAGDALEVMVDDMQIAAFGADDAEAYAGYELVALDVSDYADGKAHALIFKSITGNSGNTSFFVDDVCLVTTASRGEISTVFGSNFALFDSNASSGLDFGEARAVVPGVTERIFDRIDRNSDGELDEEELALASSMSPGCYAGPGASADGDSSGDILLVALLAGALIALGRWRKLAAPR